MPFTFWFPEHYDTVNYYHIVSYANKAVGVPVATPSELYLEQNIPNPFNASTTISFALPSTGTVRLNIYSTGGQRIRTLLDGVQSQGVHSIVWDGKESRGHDVASGIYLYRLEASGLVQVKRMLLLR